MGVVGTSTDCVATPPVTQVAQSAFSVVVRLGLTGIGARVTVCFLRHNQHGCATDCEAYQSNTTDTHAGVTHRRTACVAARAAKGRGVATGVHAGTLANWVQLGSSAAAPTMRQSPSSHSHLGYQ